MRQSSIVIHRGKKEEKYELYVEDYVISFLKKWERKQEAKDILFYGSREKNGRQITIYGAGADRHPAVFDKYELLEEVGCRLTGQDPVFLIREKEGIHEVEGYNVFYYDNTEMQDYLIQRDGKVHKKPSARELLTGSRQTIPFRREEQSFVQGGQTVRKTNPHNAVSLQLGLVFIVLVAIVINSANSYDKMEMLNQSAEEVFFVMENQEAEKLPAALSDDLLQDSVEQENARADQSGQGAAAQTDPQDGSDRAAGVQEEADQTADAQKGTDQTAGTQGGPDQTADAQKGSDQSADAQDGSDQAADAQKGTDQSADAQKGSDQPADVQKESGQQAGAASAAAEGDVPEETAKTEEGVEALSRNVARYYEIKRGDTLYMISQRIYGDTSHVKKICELNEISNPDDIHYGQKIILP